MTGKGVSRLLCLLLLLSAGSPWSFGQQAKCEKEISELSLKAVNKSGAPIAGKDIQIRYSANPSKPSYLPLKPTKTDEAGEFRISNAKQGAYEFEIDGKKVQRSLPIAKDCWTLNPLSFDLPAAADKSAEE